MNDKAETGGNPVPLNPDYLNYKGRDILRDATTEASPEIPGPAAAASDPLHRHGLPQPEAAAPQPSTPDMPSNTETSGEFIHHEETGRTFEHTSEGGVEDIRMVHPESSPSESSSDVPPSPDEAVTPKPGTPEPAPALAEPAEVGHPEPSADDTPPVPPPPTSTTHETVTAGHEPDKQAKMRPLDELWSPGKGRPTKKQVKDLHGELNRSTLDIFDLSGEDVDDFSSNLDMVKFKQTFKNREGEETERHVFSLNLGPHERDDGVIDLKSEVALFNGATDDEKEHQISEIMNALKTHGWHPMDEEPNKAESDLRNSIREDLEHLASLEPDKRKTLLASAERYRALDNRFEAAKQAPSLKDRIKYLGFRTQELLGKHNKKAGIGLGVVGVGAAAYFAYKNIDVSDIFAGGDVGDAAPSPEPSPEPLPSPEPPAEPETPSKTTDGSPEKPAEDAPATEPEFTPTDEQREISAGMGWYEKLDQLGIDPEHREEFLQEIGPELEERGLAYWDKNWDNWGMNFNENGLSNEDLEWIHDQAKAEGFLPGETPEAAEQPEEVESEPLSEYDDKLNSDTGYLNGTGYDSIAQTVEDQAKDMGVEFEFTKLQQQEGFNTTYHGLVDRVLEHNDLTWDSAKNLQPGDTLDIPKKDLQEFIAQITNKDVAELSGETISQPDYLQIKPEDNYQTVFERFVENDPRIPEEFRNDATIQREFIQDLMSDDGKIAHLYSGVPGDAIEMRWNSLLGENVFIPREDGYVHEQFVENMLNLIREFLESKK